MGAFTIAYVPTVEEVLKVGKVNTVDNVLKVHEVDTVKTVKTVETVNTVNDVRKLPHPYFPLKKYNFQKGGMLHITPVSHMYQAAYVPEYNAEFKGIQLCFTSYNIEDTYDVMVGSRYVIKGSHVKEMTEYRYLEVYEVVNVGTPIVINFYNNSGLEKYMMYEFITLVDQQIVNVSDRFDWYFYWSGNDYKLGRDDLLTLVVSQPNYVNMDSEIGSFELTITDLRIQTNIATITYNNGVLYSNYVETDPDYIGENFLARVNVIAIVSVIRYPKSIAIVFKNVSSVGVHPIEIGITGNVNNILI